jgi:hypothetical protein
VIDTTEVKASLQTLGLNPSDAELQVIMDAVSWLPLAGALCYEQRHCPIPLCCTPAAPKTQQQTLYVPGVHFFVCAQVDVDGSGGIEFSEFVRIIEQQKEQQQCREDEADTVEAFVALGGKVGS